jgi:hypothetical protein
MAKPKSTEAARTTEPTPLEWSQLPEWLQGTWPEEVYELDHFEGDGGTVECIGMSRAEYIALKVRLGELRGIRLTQAQVDALEDTQHDNNPDRKKSAA